MPRNDFLFHLLIRTGFGRRRVSCIKSFFKLQNPSRPSSTIIPTLFSIVCSRIYSPIETSGPKPGVQSLPRFLPYFIAITPYTTHSGEWLSCYVIVFATTRVVDVCKLPFVAKQPSKTNNKFNNSRSMSPVQQRTACSLWTTNRTPIVRVLLIVYRVALILRTIAFFNMGETHASREGPIKRVKRKQITKKITISAQEPASPWISLTRDNDQCMDFADYG